MRLRQRGGERVVAQPHRLLRAEQKSEDKPGAALQHVACGTGAIFHFCDSARGRCVALSRGNTWR
jgi:hypothetical protein